LVDLISKVLKNKKIERKIVECLLTKMSVKKAGARAHKTGNPNMNGYSKKNFVKGARDV